MNQPSKADKYYGVFNRWGNGTCNVDQLERFSATTVTFPASENVVAADSLMSVSVHAHIYKNTVKR
jgi:hypothetical protein